MVISPQMATQQILQASRVPLQRRAIAACRGPNNQYLKFSVTLAILAVVASCTPARKPETFCEALNRAMREAKAKGTLPSAYGIIGPANWYACAQQETFRLLQSLESLPTPPLQQRNCAKGTKLVGKPGRRQSCQKVDGTRHGWSAEWSSPGQVHLRHYYNGKRHGLASTRGTNGQVLVQGTYVDGKKHGTWRSWDINGIKRSEQTYHHGVLHEDGHGGKVKARPRPNSHRKSPTSLGSTPIADPTKAINGRLLRTEEPGPS